MIHCAVDIMLSIYCLHLQDNVVCRKISPELGQQLIKPLQHALCHCIYFSWSLSRLHFIFNYRLTNTLHCHYHYGIKRLDCEVDIKILCLLTGICALNS